MLRRIATTAAGEGSGDADFIHKDPDQPPRHDLRKPKNLADPDLTRDMEVASKRASSRRKASEDPKVKKAEEAIKTIILNLHKEVKVESVNVEVEFAYGTNVKVSIVTLDDATRSEVGED